MAAGPEIVVRYLADTAKLSAATASIEGQGSKAAAGMKKAFVPAVAALGAVSVAAGKAIGDASALNEQISASEQVFGKNAKSMQAWSETGAEAFGLSRREALSAANAYGNMFNTVGLGSKDVANMSQSMVQLAGDMASFHDQDPSEMLDKLRSGLSGEAEPLRRFGILLSDATVKQAAYANGIAKTGEELTEAQKVQARYLVITQQAGKAQGDFARTSDSVANRQRTLNAQMENLSATLGQALLPASEMFLGILSKLAGVMTEHSGAVQVAVGAVTALAAAVVAINLAMKAWAAIQVVIRAATLAWAAAQWVLNAALNANPIGLVVIAVGALIAIVILLVRHWDTVTAAWKRGCELVKQASLAVFNWLKANWPLLLGILAGPFGLAIALIIRHWDKIKEAVSGAVGAVKGYLQQLGTFFSDKAADVVAAIKRIVDWLAKPGEAAADMLAAIKSAVGAIAGFISGEVGRIAAAVARVVAAIKTPINAVLSAWNRISFSVPKFDIPGVSVMGKEVFGGASIGGQTFSVPQIPLLAQGGVVSTPTLAMLGEGRGREIVAPESLLRAIVGERPVSVRVFIGDQELRGLVRTEIVESDTSLARTLIAGARG